MWWLRWAAASAAVGCDSTSSKREIYERGPLGQRRSEGDDIRDLLVDANDLEGISWVAAQMKGSRQAPRRKDEQSAPTICSNETHHAPDDSVRYCAGNTHMINALQFLGGHRPPNGPTTKRMNTKRSQQPARYAHPRTGWCPHERRDTRSRRCRLKGDRHQDDEATKVEKLPITT